MFAAINATRLTDSPPGGREVAPHFGLASRRACSAIAASSYHSRPAACALRG